MNFEEIWPNINKIKGLLCRGQEKWLYNAALQSPGDILEIGSFHGRSTCCLAYGCSGSNKKVYAIDPFDGRSWPKEDPRRLGYYNEFIQNVENCRLSDYVVPMVGTSEDFAAGWNKSISLLFIDGSHHYKDVLFDFSAYFPHVIEGGVVAFHDVHRGHSGVLKAWRELKGQLINHGKCNNLAHGVKRKSS